jgi:hypothetical protein
VTIVTKKKWITFAEAAKIVRNCLKLDHLAAEAILRSAPLGVRRDAQLAARLEEVYEQRKQPTTELDSALDLLRKAAAQGVHQQTIAENPLINSDDLLSWLKRQGPQTSAPVRTEPSKRQEPQQAQIIKLPARRGKRDRAEQAIRRLDAVLRKEFFDI